MMLSAAVLAGKLTLRNILFKRMVDQVRAGHTKRTKLII